MKHIYNQIVIGIFLIALFFTGGCSDILTEEPHSTLTPEYFKTEAGVQGGLSALYANLRYIYGNGYYYNTCLTGTDEATYAQSADQNFKDMDFSGVGTLTASTSRSDVLWNRAFIGINTASGIIENGAAAGVSNSLIAEARFFRAFYYFQMVQTFGGVPLDLGSGELKFNTSTIRTSVRNTVPEVYTKCIFPDLLQAISDLPDASRVTGAVAKTVARLYLAKAYLTYGWWLENPNNIPTYPESARTDPNAHNAAWYYQESYSVATTAIANPGPFGLQPTFYDVSVGTNDRNKEILLYADHTEKSELFNGASLSYSNGGDADNFAGWMQTWNYTNIRSGANPDGTGPVSSVQREASQPLGRPWIRMCTPIGVIKNTFADKTNDSRYDGTFTTVYRGNWPKGGTSNAVLYNANNMPVYPNGAILTFLPDESSPITYPSGAGSSAIGAGTLPGRADYVISPNGISRIVYPGLWKLGPYRTDNGTGLGQPNAASTRPYNIAKFSELYLIAAEAAVKGASPSAGSARDLVNVLRARAGKWRWDNGGNTAKVQDNSAAMIAATPATINIDYILAERSREFYGEGYRWFDLVRTQKWSEYAATYQICGSNYGDHTPQTITRTITANYYLRPVPQSQIDGMDMTDTAKKAYQNPGY